MVLSLSQISEPLGSMKHWLRATNTIPVPNGWLICDGSTVFDAASPFNGKTLPDLRGRFPRGHNTLTNVNFPADVVYFCGGTIPSGGADTHALAHSHSGPNHRHLVSIGTHNHTLPSATVQSGAGATVASWNSGFTGLNPQSFFSEFEGSGSTGAALSTIDNKPLYNEFVIIIKIK